MKLALHAVASILIGAALGASGPVAAQTPIYRCGDSYSQNPCPGGRLIDANDSRSQGQKAQTDEATRRDTKAAAEMEKARLKQEAKPAHAALPPVKAEEPRALPSKPEKPFTAVAPKKPGDTDKKKPKKKKKERA